jgi:hypothetical protein
VHAGLANLDLHGPLPGLVFLRHGQLGKLLRVLNACLWRD